MRRDSAFRLPRSVTPSRYAVELRLDPTAPTVEGSVDIAVTVHESVDEIVLNGKDLADVTGAIIRASGAAIPVNRVVADVDAERLTLVLASELPAGQYTLR